MTETLYEQFYRYIDRTDADELEELEKINNCQVPRPAQGTNKIIDNIEIFSEVEILIRSGEKHGIIRLGKFGSIRAYGNVLVQSFQETYPLHEFTYHPACHIEVKLNKKKTDTKKCILL